MHVIERGSRIQLIRSVYDKTKKRSTGKMILSLKNYVSKLPDSARSKLTDDEIIQVEKWFVDRSKNDMSILDSVAVTSLTGKINRVASSLENDGVSELLTDELCQSIFDASDNLKKKLRKLGFKPAKKEPTKKVADDKQSEELPLQ
jgi:hypothetical protein